MAQIHFNHVQNMFQTTEKPISQEIKIRGYHQFINFGKFKGKTYYDLANENEWKYLIWCNNSFNDKNAWFKIDPSCKIHIETALRTRFNKGTWTKGSFIQDPSNSSKYTFQWTTENGLTSPTMVYLKCDLCAKKKNIACCKTIIDENTKKSFTLCHTCQSN